jgi:hypothetical protein
MADTHSTSINDTTGKFADLTGGQKVVFVGKHIVFLCTFGFAFPTLLTD